MSILDKVEAIAAARLDCTEPPDQPWTHYRAQVASLTRSRQADDPELIEARRNLRAVRLADHVAKALAEAPALTDQQRSTIARLLTTGRAPIAAGGGQRAS